VSFEELVRMMTRADVERYEEMYGKPEKFASIENTERSAQDYQVP